jgi:hypothetical protein
LNFNNQSESHKTIIGGVFSIFIKLFLTVYVTIKFKRMIFREDDSISSIIESIDLNELEAVSFKETENLIFWIVSKT